MIGGGGVVIGGGGIMTGSSSVVTGVCRNCILHTYTPVINSTHSQFTTYHFLLTASFFW